MSLYRTVQQARTSAFHFNHAFTRTYTHTAHVHTRRSVISSNNVYMNSYVASRFNTSIWSSNYSYSVLAYTHSSHLCTHSNESTHTKTKALQATFNVNGGRAELSIPLPNKGGVTTFLLLPTDDVEDIVDMIQKEVGSEVKLQVSGNTLAINTTVPRLLKGGDFDVVIGDDRYTVVNPGHELKNEYRRLCISVKNLGALMDAESVHTELVDRAQTRLNLIEKQLEPMEKSVMDARASAHRWTDTWLWGGLVVMSTQFGILARMTWWEYSWDVVEPITYFVTFGTVISTYAMYCITRTSTDYSNLSDRKYLQVLHQNMKKSGISPPQYNALLEERDRAVQQLTNLSRREY